MLSVVVASRNRDKIKEIREILKIPHLKFFTFEDFEFFPELPETGTTLKENAIIKAKTLQKELNLSVLSDDSGLEVDALGGAPGVYSARYAGEQASHEDNNRKLLKELAEVPKEKRSARFRCVAAFSGVKGELLVAEGVCEGYITAEPHGSCGFGYDPLFIPEGYGKTLAELDLGEKNKISHRGKAFRKMRKLLLEFIAREK